jgi:hypothetical protein
MCAFLFVPRLEEAVQSAARRSLRAKRRRVDSDSEPESEAPLVPVPIGYRSRRLLEVTTRPATRLPSDGGETGSVGCSNAWESRWERQKQGFFWVVKANGDELRMCFG